MVPVLTSWQWPTHPDWRRGWGMTLDQLCAAASILSFASARAMRYPFCRLSIDYANLIAGCEDRGGFAHAPVEPLSRRTAWVVLPHLQDHGNCSSRHRSAETAASGSTPRDSEAQERYSSIPSKRTAECLACDCE